MHIITYECVWICFISITILSIAQKTHQYSSSFPPLPPVFPPLPPVCPPLSKSGGKWRNFFLKWRTNGSPELNPKFLLAVFEAPYKHPTDLFRRKVNNKYSRNWHLN